jgi:hypothetical protein
MRLQLRGPSQLRLSSPSRRGRHRGQVVCGHRDEAPMKSTPTPKLTKQHGAYTFFASGGKGGAARMLDEVPAERAPRGRTGPSQVKAPGSKAARGGPKVLGFSVSLPAVGGHCAPIHKGR